jgi:hypothetical protein
MAELIRQGEQFERDGKTGVAKIFYRRAAKMADNTLRDQLLARLERLAQ